MRQIPTAFRKEELTAKKVKLGCPEELDRTEAFLEVANFLEENDDEQITISDLISKMEAILDGSEYSAYSRVHMRSKLKEHFGDNIVIAHINGKSDVVTFRNTAATILQDFYNSRQKPDLSTEKIRLVQTASKLIKSDIKLVETENNCYPSYDDFESQDKCIAFLPETLRILLEGLIVGKGAKMKIASIGQEIIQASRPRVLLAPLQFGLGVQMHHHFGSRFLIDALLCHGFCCSYNEVQQFERNAAFSHNTDIPNYRSEFVQYAADNVDHNSRTLDGHNTFHGMGMIVAITPENQCTKPIPRVKVTYKDVAIVGRVPIYFHKQERLGTEAIKFENLCSFKAQNQEANLDILWKTSILFGSPRPSWLGMMQFVHHGDHPGKSSVMFLPMIDMNPTDVSCIYSMLIFITEHAHRYNVQPIITFDQPLWWKAFLITATEPANSDLRNIVLCLGGFHTEMSFLGSIGHLMAGSGLQELFELIYAPNAVVHMLAGKALARAVRAHLTIESALNALLLSDAMKINLFSTSEVEEESTSEVEEESSLLEVVASDLCSRNSDLQEAFVLYENLMNNSLSVHQVCQKKSCSEAQRKP